MSFKTGTFAREGRALRPFTPARAVSRLTDLDPAELRDGGKLLILLDVDNTLVHHNAMEAAPEIRAWVERAQDMGIEMCIVSNTNRVERLQAIADSLGVATVRGRMKPSRRMFAMALERHGRRPEEAIMVGDQLITDVFGANRAGIDAVWVERMPGSREFWGTRVNRLVERFLAGMIYRSLVPIQPVPGVEDPVLDSPAAVLDELEHGAGATPSGKAALARQLTKFLIVGASSFVIDFTIRYLLHQKLAWNGERVSVRIGRWLITNVPSVFGGASEPAKASLWIAVLVSATIATYNGFFWNRRWTFGLRGEEGKARQLRRVYLLGYIGMGLNALLSQIYYNIVPAHPRQSLLVASLMAAASVAAFNFLGQRFWAFRPERT